MSVTATARRLYIALHSIYTAAHGNGHTRDRRTPLWIATSDVPASPGHPFYARLTAVLDAHGFDRFVEDQCRRFYAAVMGRPSLAPGQYSTRPGHSQSGQASLTFALWFPTRTELFTDLRKSDLASQPWVAGLLRPFRRSGELRP